VSGSGAGGACSRARTVKAGQAAAGARIGAALGLALGFVGFALALPLEGASYHYPGSGSFPLFEASTVRAALTWGLGAALGLAAGAVAGAALGRALAGERGPRLATAALGVYALALRAAWGYAGPLPAEAGRAAAAPSVTSVVLPVAVAAAAIALLWGLAGRRRTETADAAPWIATHAVFSLTAAVLAAQLAYYASRAGAFLWGLLEVVRATF